MSYAFIESRGSREEIIYQLERLADYYDHMGKAEKCATVRRAIERLRGGSGRERVGATIYTVDGPGDIPATEG